MNTFKTEQVTGLNTTNNKIHNLVNELIAINHDRCEGYRIAASQVHDNDIKELCNNLSLLSEQFIEELQALIPSNVSVWYTSVSDTLYRSCIYVKGPALVNDRKRILLACRIGEQMALNTYSAVLDEPALPEMIKLTIDRQVKYINTSLVQIKNYRDIA